MLVALCRGLRVAAANSGMSTRPRMRPGGRRNMPSMRKNGLGERERIPLGSRSSSEGEEEG
jgi:hypothetical protein